MCKHTTSERICTYIQPHPVKKAQYLQSTMLKSTALKRLNTYIRPCSKAPHRKGLALTIDHARKHYIERDMHLYPTMLEITTSKGHALTSDHGGTNPTIALEWPPVPD